MTKMRAAACADILRHHRSETTVAAVALLVLLVPSIKLWGTNGRLSERVALLNFDLSEKAGNIEMLCGDLEEKNNNIIQKDSEIQKLKLDLDQKTLKIEELEEQISKLKPNKPAPPSPPAPEHKFTNWIYTNRTYKTFEGDRLLREDKAFQNLVKKLELTINESDHARQKLLAFHYAAKE